MHSLPTPILGIEASGWPAPSGAAPPLSLTLMLAFTCLALSLVVGILVLGFFLARDKAKSDEQRKEHSEPKD
jgi:hypothetical protein